MRTRVVASQHFKRVFERVSERTCLTLALCATLTSTTYAQVTPATTDSAAIVRAAENVLRAISTRDTALARRSMLAGSQLVSIADPASSTTNARVQSDSLFIAMLANGTQKYLERMWSPIVWQQGSLAQVRAPYDFHIDGKFSHCGVDVFTLVRARDQWLVSNISYTTQRAGCAPSPLGVVPN